LSRYSAERPYDFADRLPRDPDVDGLTSDPCAETTRGHLTHIEAFDAVKVVERSIVLQYLSQEREVSRGIHAEIVRMPPEVIEEPFSGGFRQIALNPMQTQGFERPEQRRVRPQKSARAKVDRKIPVLERRGVTVPGPEWQISIE
jgi:hypothetical protein